jgi:hypothetical protein
LAQTSKYVQNNAARKTATLRVIAGEGGGGLNFNGVVRGAKGFVVPLGWTVELKFKNADPNMPHSIIVVPQTPNIPVVFNPQMAAFKGAASKNVAQGVDDRAPEETLRFVADKAGKYLLVCGVPGHGTAGQWLGFEVSKSAKEAVYR